MKKFLILFSLIFLTPIPSLAKLKVVTTLPIFGSLATAVGGDRVLVKALIRAHQDPHFLDAKPSYVVAINRADLLIHTGMDLEIGWLPAVLVQSRNPKVQSGAVGNLDASLGIAALEIPTGKVDRSQGHVHPAGNPHFWLDPRNGAILARSITQKLCELDAEGTHYYQTRLQTFLKQLDQHIEKWSKETSTWRKKKIITYHKNFTYFANWSGIDIVAHVEPKPGIPPHSKHVAGLVNRIKQEKINAIMMAPYYPKKIPEYLSEKTQVPLVVVPSNSEGIEAGSFFKMFENIMGSLIQNL